MDVPDDNERSAPALRLLALPVLVGAVVPVAAFLGGCLGDAPGLSVGIGAALAALTYLLLRMHASFRGAAREILERQVRQERRELATYRQIESLMALHACLDLVAPLPPMRGWAASPDFAVTLLRLVRERRPATIVELGSGTSTIVMAYALKQLGAGRIVSLDHDAAYAEHTRRALAEHALTEQVAVQHAALGDVAIEDETWSWYDREALAAVERIDLLVIDGPPTIERPDARYPALPLLWDRLADDAIIVLDDARRPGDRAIIQRWLGRFQGLQSTVLDSEEGTCILRRG